MTDAQIYSRGYRSYQGPRSGVSGAVRSVTWHSVRSVLGIGRPARHKVLPLLIIGFAYVPSVIYVGLAVLFGNELFDELAPPYSDAIGAVFFQVLLFAAFVVPGVLVRDRRDGMLAMYLSSPLERSTYLLAKWCAVFGVLLFVTLGPAMLQLLGYTFSDVGPDGVGNWLLTFVRIVVSGAFVAAVLSALGMGASSLTDRPSFASAGIILLFLVSAFVYQALSDAGLGRYTIAISLVDVTVDSVRTIFGESVDAGRPSGWFSLAISLLWTAIGAALVWIRYRRVTAIR